MTGSGEKTDVLVVGFGPVGAAITNLLGRYGVRTIAIDTATTIFPQPRAIALDNEALRILQLAGLPEGAFETIAIPEVRMHSPYVGQLARLDTGGCLDGHPKLVTFYQPELELALRSRVRDYPHVTVALGVELIDFAEEASGVRARLRRQDGSVRTVHAQYLIGADGAKSTVREALGVGFDGRTYIEDWLIVDAKHASTSIDHIEFLCDPRRPTPHMVAPGGRQRWEFMLHPGESRDEMLRLEKVRELLSPWGGPDDMEIERTAVYRFHARTVEHFRKGRAFLAGDAAHITPPFAGQGLVAGLRDAANLCWKLAWVVQKRADPIILESYDQERRPHAKAMIALARLLGRIVMPRSRAQALGTGVLMRTLRLIPAARSYFEDLKIKPQNQFDQGLFVGQQRRLRGDVLRSTKARLTRGALFPQAWVQQSTRGCWSDEALGLGLVLIGFGVDPGVHLGRAADDWREAGGSCIQLCHRGQRLHRGEGDHVWEDITGAFVPVVAPVGWSAIVRPDRTVLHDGPATEAPRLIREALDLLGAPRAPSFSSRETGSPTRVTTTVAEREASR
ncbi:MAG: bifunctional 3-(3-hydroxy-phenyl)propionate/3-hydroxycinnamic acid hydroxylase [Polyangiales bacterium]|jgi:3-(3-hydroxy-phenyl)propionate hydroxylase